jgi:Cu-Zn family superoxide dismutase
MLKILPSLAFGAAAGLVAFQPAMADHHEGPAQPVEAAVTDTAGEAIGTAKFEETRYGVLVSVAVEGIPEGEHGFHIHEKGVCDPADGFKSAGGHFNPSGHDHGLKAEGGLHAGDMPNQFSGAGGAMRAQVLNPNVTLGAGDDSLFDADGSALIIHAGVDDYLTQPTGAAGGRLACAVISPPREM